MTTVLRGTARMGGRLVSPRCGGVLGHVLHALRELLRCSWRSELPGRWRLLCRRSSLRSEGLGGCRRETSRRSCGGRRRSTMLRGSRRKTGLLRRNATRGRRESSRRRGIATVLGRTTLMRGGLVSPRNWGEPTVLGLSNRCSARKRRESTGSRRRLLRLHTVAGSTPNCRACDPTNSTDASKFLPPVLEFMLRLCKLLFDFSDFRKNDTKMR